MKFHASTMARTTNQRVRDNKGSSNEISPEYHGKNNSNNLTTLLNAISENRHCVRRQSGDGIVQRRKCHQREQCCQGGAQVPEIVVVEEREQNAWLVTCTALGRSQLNMKLLNIFAGSVPQLDQLYIADRSPSITKSSLFH